MFKQEHTKFFSIQSVAELSGLSAHTIRAWEKRYKAITPKRDDIGKRIYNEVELKRLKVLALLVNLGSTISQIAGLSDAELSSMLEKLTLSKNKWSPKTYLSKDELRSLIGPMLVDVAEFNMEQISQKLSMASFASTSKDFAFSVVLPLLGEVKSLRQENKLTLSHAQSLQSIVRFHASHSLIPKTENMSDKKIFIASVDGIDANDTLPLALLCRHYDQTFFYSHIHLPLTVMVETAVLLASKIIILHFPHEPAVHLLEKLLELVPSGVEIWVHSPTHKEALHKQMQFYRDYEELDQFLSSLG